MDDYCRCCGRSEPEVKLRSTPVPNPLNNDAPVLITLCGECVKKGASRDPEVCDKLKPFLTAAE